MSEPPADNGETGETSGPDESRATAPDGARRAVTSQQLGIAAGVISAVAALITAVVSIPWIRGADSASSPSGSTMRQTVSTDAEPRVLGKLLLQDPLVVEDALPGYASDDGGCKVVYRREALRFSLREDKQFLLCSSETAGLAEAGRLATARVEVNYRVTALPESSYKQYGPGNVGLRCRGEGSAGKANAIMAFLTANGWASIDRYRNGEQDTLVERHFRRQDTAEGEQRRLRLDCVEQDDGTVAVSLFVDDDLLATTTVTKPPLPGDVGVVVGNYTKEPYQVAFSDLRVYVEG